jgi:hypothetical protein
MAQRTLRLTVIGEDRVRRALEHLDADELPDRLATIHLSVGRRIAAHAKAHGPRRTGRLVDSVKPVRSRRSAGVTYGGPAIPYAGPIHFGWPARGIRAQPFVAIAAKATESGWATTYRNRLQDIVREASNGR